MRALTEYKQKQLTNNISTKNTKKVNKQAKMQEEATAEHNELKRGKKIQFQICVFGGVV